MTATRYASIALIGRVVACGNSITDWTSELVSNLIGRCREKSLLICIGFNFLQLLSVASPKTVVYVTMHRLPLKCMGFRNIASLVSVSWVCTSNTMGQDISALLCVCVCVCVCVCGFALF